MNDVFHPDIIQDIRQIDFDDGSVSEVVAQDILCHVTYYECLEVLRKIYRWLDNNGSLLIHLPNLKIVGVLASGGEHEAIKWLYGSDGGSGNENYWSNVIRWAYTPKMMRDILTKLGYQILMEEIDCGGYGFKVMAVKRTR